MFNDKFLSKNKNFLTLKFRTKKNSKLFESYTSTKFWRRKKKLKYKIFNFSNQNFYFTKTIEIIKKYNKFQNFSTYLFWSDNTSILTRIYWICIIITFSFIIVLHISYYKCVQIHNCSFFKIWNSFKDLQTMESRSSLFRNLELKKTKKARKGKSINFYLNSIFQFPTDFLF